MAIVKNITIGMQANTKKLASGLSDARSQLLKFQNWAKGGESTILGFDSALAGATKRLVLFATNPIGLLETLVSTLANAGMAIVDLGVKLAAITFKGLLVGLAGVGAGAVYLTKLGSDAEEARNKFDAVFGDMSADARNFAKQLSAATNRSRYGIEDMMAGIADLVKPMGLTTEQAAAMSKQVAALTMDLGSFSNLSPEVVLEKIRSGVAGESEPLKQLGVIVNEDAVKLKLLEMGFQGNVSAANAAQKAFARLAIVQDATEIKGAWGDAAKTMNSVANQTIGLKGALEDLGKDLGTSLLPMASEVLKYLRAWIPSADEVKTAFGGIDFAGMFKTALSWINETAAGVQLMTSRVIDSARELDNWRTTLDAIGSTLTTVRDVLLNADLAVEAVSLRLQKWGAIASAVKDL